MATAALTKPQADFLWKLMDRPGIEPYGAEWRTFGTLTVRGLADNKGLRAYVTTAGLKALADYWMRKDAASGCVAYQQHRQRVEAELAKATGGAA